ncbi:GNAT family N-acetyltransferase [Jannaschia pohangensis]|uniref:Acetyltransferase (GNAT) domain-containing protein n=1 Tax=Jannaschia pohangensis TaxID=390807 RepID=A0A1I3JP76_9RHOB|nr:GNAT family N-acetyltransferase [Jannaschia pohangensis]SFI61964.1 Acetyltransferase (GNAT) domain-containing protein [Jannaschia pohangensis]
MLTDGFHDVPPGRVAAVVTHLEMTTRPDPRATSLQDGLSLRRVERPDTGWYRDLFTRVGALDWLWFSRLQMAEARLAAILSDPGVEVWALERDGHAEGLLELDFRQPEEPELAFLGLTQTMQGAGAGRALMDHAISRAFARPIRRFTVHTCTFDSPVALPFYIRSGFVPVRREVEIVPDPRLTGAIPEHSAGHHPIIAPH